jgi:chemotaxis protein histidine kinase CheA
VAPCFATPAPAAQPPAPQRTQSPQTQGSTEAKTPAKTTAAPPPAPESAAPRPLADADRQKLDRVRAVLAQQPGAAKEQLREAYQVAKEVADAHPEAKDAQHLAGEAAYRISRWSEAAVYFRRGGDPGDGEPERLFYMAVVFFESGDAAAASAALKRSLPSLKRTPYVESYIRKILGTQGGA